MRTRILLAAAVAGLTAVGAAAAVDLDHDKFQFVDVDMGRGVLSIDISTITHTGDAATLTLVEWERPGQASAIVITPMQMDCAAKTVVIYGMEARTADGTVVKTDSKPTAPTPVGDGQNVLSFAEALACSKFGKVENLPIIEGKTAAEAYAADYFAKHVAPAE